MSTCHEKELHSMLVDGEINSPWFEEVKSHVENCSECKSHVESLNSMRSIFAQDSESLNLTNEQMSASFERLQSRLRYTQVAAKTNTIYADFTKKVMPYAAAAALLVAVMLPAVTRRSATVTTLHASLLNNVKNVELIDKTGIAFDQNMNGTAVKVSDTASKKVGQPVALHVSNLTKNDIFKPEFATETSSKININLVDVTTLPLITQPDFQQSAVYPVSE